MKRMPTVVERFADNGEHSHWEMVDADDGEMVGIEFKVIFEGIDSISKSFKADRCKGKSDDYIKGYLEGIRDVTMTML
jgi:hypothetical protein